ncbi:hypothetical protein QTP88_020735 [Uroleucon formosanum]
MAIEDVKDWVNSRKEKYVMGIFLDISGAFDNVKWEPLIHDMQELSESTATVNITKSYLCNRTAKISSGNVSISKLLIRGYICSNDAQNSSVLSLNGVELSNNQTLNILNNNEELVDSQLESEINEIEPTVLKKSKKLNKNKWKRTVSKNLRLKGLIYTNRSGKKISEKIPKSVDCSKCRYKCNDKVSEEERYIICKEYWNLGDDIQQKLLLSSLVLNKPVNRRQILSNDKQKTSREFFLCNLSGEQNRGCLKFFCATFSISHRVVEICMKKVSKTGVYVGHDVSDFVYRSVFHDYDPSLSFFIPKKDQCTKCNSYQMAPNKSTLQEEWEMHKLRKNQTMNMKAEDKKKSN